jgi:hypothetical protein
MDRILIVGLCAAISVLLVWVAVKALEWIGNSGSSLRRFRPGRERTTIVGGWHTYPVCVYDPCIGMACCLVTRRTSPATVKIGTARGIA